MSVLAWIRDFALWWRYERRPPRDKVEAIQRIREHFGAMGYPISDMSDEEIEAGVERLRESVRAVGMSAQDAATAMSQVVASVSAAGEPWRF